MPIRLVAIDIDGTLLDSQWQLPAANLDAITAAVRHGVEVVLATGRRFDFARPIVQLVLPVEIVIVSGGALLKRRDGVTLARWPLPRATAWRVLTETAAFRQEVGVVFDRNGGNQLIFERVAWGDPRQRAYLEHNRHALGEVTPLEDCLTEDPIQIMAAGSVDRMRALADILDGLPDHASFEVALTEYPTRDLSIVDVTGAGVSKGAALGTLARARGLVREQIMAIGDNHNDRSMLEIAGFPVVMGNASDHLKASGWLETASNDQAGVAKAIEQYVLRYETCSGIDPNS